MDLEPAVRGADVVVTATNALEPFLRGEWLKEGAHVNSVGSPRPTWRELDDAAMNSTLIVARREFRSNFDSPIGYVVIALSLLGVGAFFFRDYWTINRTTVSGLFQWLPWAFTFFVIPAITMRLLSEEKRTGMVMSSSSVPVRFSYERRRIVIAGITKKVNAQGSQVKSG